MKTLIDTYVAELENTLPDDKRFPAVVGRLKDDNRVSREDAVEIACLFFAPIARSTSRNKALRHIAYRHERLMDSRRASESIGKPRGR